MTSDRTSETVPATEPFTATLPEDRRSRVPRWIGPEALRQAVSMADAIDALDEALRSPAGVADPTPRSWFDAGEAKVAFMPAVDADGGVAKLVSVQQANAERGLPVIQGVYVVFEPETYAPAVLIGGQELTALRTPAVSGLATRYLARPDAHRLVVFGTGVQARGHVEAMLAVRPIDSVVVVGRSAAGTAAFVEDLQDHGIAARAGEPADVVEADVICTCTTSSVPVFDGRLLPEGVHVNAIGAYSPDTRELDSETMARARVVVENRSVSIRDSGDLAIPMAEGLFGDEHVVSDLTTLHADEVRTTPECITVFTSIGMAFEDRIVAAAVLRGLDGS